MTKGLFTRFVLIAAIAALALAFAPETSFAAKKKAKAKKKEAPAAQAGGTCTSYCNAFKWCHVRWKTSGGAIPTVLMCSEGACPPKC